MLSLDFDATLGFLGEGPSSYDHKDDTPLHTRTRNTFIETPIPTSPTRTLRFSRSDPTASPSHPPPFQLRRLDELGQSAPGSQESNDSNMPAGASQDSQADTVPRKPRHQYRDSCKFPIHILVNDTPLTIYLTRATIPGPASASSTRVYCRVAGCPDNVPERAAGWSTHTAMRSHLNEHGAGCCIGQVPADYIRQHRLNQCPVCSKFISSRFGGTCPACRPSLGRSATSNAHANSSRRYTGPPLEELFSKRVPTKSICSETCPAFMVSVFNAGSSRYCGI